MKHTLNSSVAKDLLNFALVGVALGTAALSVTPAKADPPSCYQGDMCWVAGMEANGACSGPYNDRCICYASDDDWGYSSTCTS